jgi:hypothetical protein
MSFHQDLDNMTRDMHAASMEVEYMKRTPALNLILEQSNRKFNGGKKYEGTMDTDTVEDLAQDYVINQALTHGTADTSEEYSFRRKYCQLPITMDFEEQLENALQNEDRTQLHALAKFKNQKAQEGMRLHLRKLIYGAASDTAAQIQGLNSALIPDATYGGLTRTRASNVNDFWQPANNVYTSSTYASARTISIEAIEGWVDPLQDLENGGGRFVIIVGNTLWLALKSEAHALSMPIKSDPGGLFKYGIEEMELDGMRIIKDPFLQTTYNTAMGMTTGSAGSLDRRFYALNIPDWYFMVHPKDNFRMAPFFDQSQIAGAPRFDLARIFLTGNLVCLHPNRSLYFSNVTP